MTRRILHVITGLTTGGAEMMLCKLMERGDRARFLPTVIALGSRAEMADRYEALDVEVITLGMPRGRPTLAGVIGLLRATRRAEPDLIQGWMYHGNLAASFAARFAARHAPAVWNVRQSLDGMANHKRSTAALIRAGGRRPFRPSRIVYNSRVGARQHERLGYATERTVVIPNGFDCERFRPSSAAREALRAELGLPGDAPLVGLVARYDPVKDHASFIEAATPAAHHASGPHFVLAGPGVDRGNAALVDRIAAGGLTARVHLLGARDDIPSVTAALDVACSASAWGEGFSNTIGEAMACGVPCVATDVGDAAWLVGKTGQVVAPGDPPGLAAAWNGLLRLDPQARAELGRAARRRIETEFDLGRIVARYENLYAAELNGAGAAAGED